MKRPSKLKIRSLLAVDEQREHKRTMPSLAPVKWLERKLPDETSFESKARGGQENWPNEN